MIICEEKWQHIPLLHIVADELIDKDIPVVVFFHGFTSAKEHNLHYAYNLANQGMRVLLPEAHLHGVRSEGLDEVEMGLRFWEIVLTNLEELKILYKTLQEKGLLKKAKIGVGGTSMGGITTLGALKVYDWIDVASVMMGAPNYVELAKAQIQQFESKGFEIPVSYEERQKLFEQLAYFDLTKHRDALKGRPVYFWHGKNDVVVPYKPTFKFFKELQEDYKSYPEKLSFMTDQTAGHAVSRKGMLTAVDWFASHLKE